MLVVAIIYGLYCVLLLVEPEKEKSPPGKAFASVALMGFVGLGLDAAITWVFTNAMSILATTWALLVKSGMIIHETAKTILSWVL
jgi:hypothetical protein